MLIECNYCKATVDAKEISKREDEDEVTGLRHNMIFAECPSCQHILLGMEIYQNDRCSYYRVYPPPDREPNYLLPKHLRKTFKEALTCLRTECYSASAIMCRKTLEGLCDHYLHKFNNLSDGLKKLHQQNIIDSRLFEWAEELRKHGNLAAHEAKTEVKYSDAEDIAEFTEAILNYVFVLHERFIEYKKRRGLDKTCTEFLSGDCDACLYVEDTKINCDKKK